ncbi:hypothetical protein O7623_07780 [Solwaraspora sp. WMMD791]|uniref:hypothetical protein n=1 Tax=Solwaraspora sp. WMMD791 TaxID=3016086 RepID=UPI00249CCF37|nr:hypothetical protein [Solwaraspora sp. WMMD791]WFE29072.1 hypothetical protein O7623_07780 [Solwaraspora sp. WMMD791]
MHMSPGRPIGAPDPDHPAADGPGEAVAVPADPGGDDAAPTDSPTPGAAHAVGQTPDTAPTAGAAFDGDHRDPYQPL